MQENAQSLVKCKVLSDSALDGVRLYETNVRTSAISDGLYRLSQFFEDIKGNGESFVENEFCVENYNNIF